MVLVFWGVRGGIPVPGASTVKVGGNTACIDISDDDGVHAVMDMGTGIIGLGKSLLAGPCGKGQGNIHIFLTHTHWDHIQGFPYFIPGFIPGNKIHFWGRAVSERSLYDVLDGQMKAEYNPIFSLKNMGSQISVQEMGRDPVDFGSFTLTTTILPHRGKASLGFRITDGAHTVALLGDVHYEHGLQEAIVDFVKGADLLVHDAGDVKMPGDDYNAVTLAKKAGVKRLLLTHYTPEFTDDDVARLIEAAKKAGGDDVAVDGASEGLEVTL